MTVALVALITADAGDYFEAFIAAAAATPTVDIRRPTLSVRRVN